MKIILFHTSILTFRGSVQALLKYAQYNESLLCNKSLIITDFRNFKLEHLEMFDWITEIYHLPILFYFSIEHLKEIIAKQSADFLYTIEYGKRNELSQLEKNIKMLVHCVFDMSEPYGYRYVAVSKSLANKFSSGENKFVPHIVDSDMIGNPDITFRTKYNIPKEAIVFASISSPDIFNLEFAKHVISQIVRERSDIYFMFMNINSWDNHPQIIYFEPSVDIEIKRKFIQTSDAMIVPEIWGHTFGLSISEFSINNKPIICYNGKDVWNTAHIDILGDKGIYFDNPKDFKNILENFLMTCF